MHKAILKDSRIDISIVIPIGIDVSIPVASDTSPNVPHTRMSLPLVVRIVIYVALYFCWMYFHIQATSTYSASLVTFGSSYVCIYPYGSSYGYSDCDFRVWEPLISYICTWSVATPVDIPNVHPIIIFNRNAGFATSSCSHYYPDGYLMGAPTANCMHLTLQSSTLTTIITIPTAIHHRCPACGYLRASNITSYTYC
jgi:hypothetical protein